MLFLAVTTLYPAQKTPSVAIRFLNGKNGKPISDKQVTVQFGKGASLYRDADSKGEIVLDIPDGGPRELRVRPDDYFDCRFTHDQTGPAGLQLKYSLDEIISKGIVGENLCGNAHVLPTPGVLTLYLRPRTFIEKWKL
jgi:hypothetical protein